MVAAGLRFILPVAALMVAGGARQKPMPRGYFVSSASGALVARLPAAGLARQSLRRLVYDAERHRAARLRSMAGTGR